MLYKLESFPILADYSSFARAAKSEMFLFANDAFIEPDPFKFLKLPSSIIVSIFCIPSLIASSFLKIVFVPSETPLRPLKLIDVKLVLSLMASTNDLTYLSSKLLFSPKSISLI